MTGRFVFHQRLNTMTASKWPYRSITPRRSSCQDRRSLGFRLGVVHCISFLDQDDRHGDHERDADAHDFLRAPLAANRNRFAGFSESAETRGHVRSRGREVPGVRTGETAGKRVHSQGMTDREALIAAARRSPSDAAVRMALADHFDEHDDPDTAAGLRGPHGFLIIALAVRYNAAIEETAKFCAVHGPYNGADNARAFHEEMLRFFEQET